MEKNMIITLLLIGLIIISAVQTIQLVVLRGKVSNGGISTVGETGTLSQTQTTTTQKSAPSSSGMVGGC